MRSPLSRTPAFDDRFPLRSRRWKIRGGDLEFPVRPLLMGIINVTPDSFSDGGKFLETTAAVDQAMRLVEEGADLIDVGGESTRPYAEPVAADDELRRVIPVIGRLCESVPVPVSVDTSKAVVARRALEACAHIINDITGFEGDAEMLEAAVKYPCGICVMHMQGTPQTMQDRPVYDDVVANILDDLLCRRDRLVSAGIEFDRICLDPGIGFGKTHQHNLTLMAHCGAFHQIGSPLLVGHSRKGFLGKILGDPDADRTAATAGAALTLALQGVQVIRVHDVRPVRDALIAFEATGGLSGREWQL